MACWCHILHSSSAFTLLDISSGTQSTTDDRTSISYGESNGNQSSYGVYVGIAIGLAAILIASIVTLIIISKRKQQASHKEPTNPGRELEAAKKHGDRCEQEIANIANPRLDGKVNKSNQSHLNVHNTNNYSHAEMPDVQFGQVSNTGDENTYSLPYKQQNITYDHGKVDDAYNTTYESSGFTHDDTYDHISRQDVYNATNIVNKNAIVDPTYDHTAEHEPCVKTQTMRKNALTDPTYDHTPKHDSCDTTYSVTN